MQRMIAAAIIVLIAGLTLGAAATPSPLDCETRANDTPPKVAECIRLDSLWKHLKRFQAIAEKYPTGGHPNRDTGTPGYKASAAYVAGMMKRAGYDVTIQSYNWRHSRLIGVPTLNVAGRDYQLDQDWSVAQLSGSGRVTALIQPAGNGCEPRDFGRFVRGHVALLARALCPADTQVAHAQAAGASAVVFYNTKTPAGEPAVPHRETVQYAMATPASIPVLEIASAATGDEWSHAYAQGAAVTAQIDVNTRTLSDIDYNVIADSPFGDPNHIVVVDAHLDAIYGEGMLDNASGSTSILDTALALARTRTANRLRYIWFGGEELGLLGSKFYTRNLPQSELKKIVFDIDVDVTATPNYAILIADPANASDARKFPPHVIGKSHVGNQAFIDYFRSVSMVAKNARIGNDGTDSNSFSLVGVPNSGIFTQQDCCKHPDYVRIWGGYPGDYEGKIPGWHGYCVDRPRHWCDNLSNNDPTVLEFVSKAVAYVTLELANDSSLTH